MAEARRTIDLLWFSEPASRRGRKKGLTLARVVDTAIVLADDEGLDAVSMRRVAQELGVVPMTLYTYVPDKAALLDLMLDAVYLRMSRAEPAGESWRERLAAVAEDNRLLYEQHPWAAGISQSRPPLGPGLMAKYEHELRAFAGAGLDDVETDAALTYLLGFVQASARAEADARAEAARSARSDHEWWAENGPLLAKVFDPQAYPTAVRVGAAAGAELGGAYHPGRAYVFGLERVLDGLGVLIDRRAADQRR
ncbi:TetR/AcrR family transcriptional regulator [Amorphoplanes nipponensis]|uniref:TetR family transcriptional regulator n=1 Tax=Actinoplanes nipponensis TaxID=135950 RepID=A0A919JMA7_9ACTN|nr:TetR/AcrR family transcriptional regulator C-terminal domain-containing protein [Actinoplanes nipponensis]GIE51992.1 TetR family transcriptional regulator [Actinoplanes nipponensis]